MGENLKINLANKTEDFLIEDLGNEKYLSEIRVEWSNPNNCTYKLEISMDGENWVMIQGNRNFTPNSIETSNPIHSWARFIKLTVINGNAVELTISTNTAPDFISGVDISHLPQIEYFGGKFYNRRGVEQDLIGIMKDHNVNYIRLKIWNKPGLPNSDPSGYNDKAHVLDMAKRCKKEGLKLLLDFHYSDWWTDPGKQFMPEDWKGLEFHELTKALYDFTYDVISAMKEQGTMPEMVQVGNEITNGMLWDTARVSGEFDTDQQWDSLCTLLKSGLKAVKTVDASIKTIIHIERGGANEASVYFYNKLKERNVDFDIIGLSYYPIWHGPIEAFRNNIIDLAARYGKGIIVVETAYPYTTEDGDDQPNASTFPFTNIPEDYPPSIKNQANILQAIIHALKSLPDGMGMGIFYWQPDFIPVKGAGWKYGEGCEWDDQTLFDFTGHALWSLDIFKMHRS